MITSCKRIVIKVGTSTLTYPSGSLNLRRIGDLVRTISDFKNAGHEVVVVSSGAVGAGFARLGLTKYPDTLAKKQACAAVGQSQLMKIYESFFGNYGHTVAQILMTKDVIDDPHRLELVKNTFSTLIEMGCVPIVNENDSVSSEELQFGGNDTLSAYVGIASDADLIINLSDINGLYNKDPRKHDDAVLIDRVDEINDEIRSYAGGAGTNRGTGGMITKIKAAEIASKSGIPMLIINGSNPFILYEILDGKHVGTYFAAKRG
ncbi:MAG: glutamate 5-kinase [Clostridia bacterium]|nr:glutamate 5-kinase [Clostridia bacterium]